MKYSSMEKQNITTEIHGLQTAEGKQESGGVPIPAKINKT